MWPHYILYVLNYVHNYYGPYAYCSLDKGIAYTGGGGVHLHNKTCGNKWSDSNQHPQNTFSSRE